MDRIDTPGALPGGRRRRRSSSCWPSIEVGDPIDAGSLASVVRGLGTAEYLLFGADDPAEVTGPGRCDLLLAVTDGAADGTADAAAAWGEGWQGGAPYADTLAGRGDGAMEANAALAELIRGIDAILSEMTVQELGLALGITREDPLPEALDEGPAGAAGQVLAARIAGIEALYDPPGETPGLGDLVADRSPEVDDAVRAQVDTALGALESLGSPLVPALEASPDQATALYDSLVRAATDLPDRCRLSARHHSRVQRHRRGQRVTTIPARLGVATPPAAGARRHVHPGERCLRRRLPDRLRAGRRVRGGPLRRQGLDRSAAARPDPPLPLSGAGAGCDRGLAAGCTSTSP